MLNNISSSTTSLNYQGRLEGKDRKEYDEMGSMGGMGMMMMNRGFKGKQNMYWIWLSKEKLKQSLIKELKLLQT